MEEIKELVERNSETITTLKKSRDPQIIIAIALGIISVCAVVVSLFQANVMQKQAELMREQSEAMRNQAKAGVWPYLQIGVNRGFKQNQQLSAFKIYVSNQGSGPAIVEGVRLNYKGKTFKNWSSFMDTIDPENQGEHGVSKGQINQKVIRPGEVIEVLNLSHNLPLANLFFSHADELSLVIVYRSVFEDYWLANRDGFGGADYELDHESITENPIKKEEQFLN